MQPILLNDLVRPGTKSAQALILRTAGTRILVAQQFGLRPDGHLEKGLKAQMERAWLNVFAVLDAAAFKKQHIVKTTTFVTEPGRMMMVREIRDRMLEGHPCLSSCFQVSALQLPSLLCEIEVEALKAP